MKTEEKTEETMLRNFVRKYGYNGLKKITKLFRNRASNQIIAEEFEVTRQRVHQWQKAFTHTQVELKQHVKIALGEE